MLIGEEKGSWKVLVFGEFLKEIKELIVFESIVKKEENKMEEEKCLLKNLIFESDVKFKFSKS